MFHVTRKENLYSIMKNGLIPQIGENSEGLENEPLVFLFPDEDSMNTALSSWFGALYDDEDELISLKISLPTNWELISDVEYEYASKYLIPPEYIEFFKEE